MQWYDDNPTPEKMKSEVIQMRLMIHSKAFNLNHEVPLNKRFIKEFSKVIETQGFVVAESLPQDKVTIFGKSQPDITIYKSKGEYIKGKRIIGASICTQDQGWEVIGATVELKKSVIHLKSRSPEQACANMVRVAGFLTEKALRKGHIVEEVTIYIWSVGQSFQPLCHTIKI